MSLDPGLRKAMSQPRAVALSRAVGWVGCLLSCLSAPSTHLATTGLDQNCLLLKVVAAFPGLPSPSAQPLAACWGLIRKGQLLCHGATGATACRSAAGGVFPVAVILHLPCANMQPFVPCARVPA